MVPAGQAVAATGVTTGSAINLDVVIPPNTTAQVYVPTTNAAGITESGLPAVSSPGLIYVGTSNGCAIYNVGSGHYLWSSPFAISVAVNNVIITTTNQVGSGSGTFTPAWTAVTNGSLIAGKLPSNASGNFSLEVSGRNVSSLTAGGGLGLTQIVGGTGYPITTSTNYVTCGSGSGAGSLVLYSLTNSVTGYDLTNITVYGGWADNGRDQQAYTVYYSTVAAPTNFLLLTRVNFNPAIANNLQSATRVTITPATGPLASNVVAVKFDFSSPASENGFCGYAEITLFGKASAPPPATLSATPLAGATSFVMNVGGLSAGINYALQSTTNLGLPNWSTETNFIATQARVAFTNATTNYPQKYYRIFGN